jgi:pantoate--beta-alanine ligase
MYPPGFQTSVIVSEVTGHLEGRSRPTHFQGVTTIVAKLFNIVNPQRAYFGQKDAQQVVVVRRMAKDLNFDLEIVVCPIIREPDGLAMSSRNARLTPKQRSAAPVLYRALSAAAESVTAGERDASVLRNLMTEMIVREPLSRLDYVSVADGNTLRELERVDKDALLSGAIFVGDVRLIDNIPI